jgi:tol-pal system protein YbgF
MRALLFGLAWAILCAVAPARAALFGDDEARKAIIDLRAKVAEQDRRTQEQLADLAARLERLEAAQRGQLEFANTVDALRQEIARLRGQIDVLANEVATQQQRNRDLYADLDTRLKALEPKPVTIDGKSIAVPRDEQAAYDAALVLFRAGDYKSATTSLRQFLSRYPQSVYVPSAWYWLGNAYYQQRDYREAVSAHQLVVDKYPESSRAPEALLGLAASQAELKDRTRSRASLQKLIKDYPDTEAAKIAKERLAAMGKG